MIFLIAECLHMLLVCKNLFYMREKQPHSLISPPDTKVKPKALLLLS